MSDLVNVRNGLQELVVYEGFPARNWTLNLSSHAPSVVASSHRCGFPPPQRFFPLLLLFRFSPCSRQFSVKLWCDFHPTNPSQLICGPSPTFLTLIWFLMSPIHFSVSSSLPAWATAVFLLCVMVVHNTASLLLLSHCVPRPCGHAGLPCGQHGCFSDTWIRFNPIGMGAAGSLRLKTEDGDLHALST